MIRFSVVIPNFNSPIVDSTIESIRSQSYDQDLFEIIIVGRDDPNLIPCADWIYFDRSEQPLLPGAARNRGAAQAKEDIIAFIDSDCIADPNWLAVLAHRFDNINVNIVGGGIAFDDDNYWTLTDNISLFHDYLASRPPGTRRQLPSLNLAIRRELFLSAGGFDENRPIGEDSDLTTRLRKGGQILYFEPNAIVWHRPPRNRLADMIQHNFLHGKYSIKVDPQYIDESGLPRLLRSRLGILLASPIIAAATTIRIYVPNRNLWNKWRTALGVLLAKFIWCLGAANRPNRY